MRIYIGHEERELDAYRVAEASARAYGCDVQPLYEHRLRLAGLLTRPVDTRGQWFDLNSGAPQSTAFANARFWVPLLAHSGWCLFADCDALFLRDPNELREFMDPTKAVMVVQHDPALFVGGSMKMDGQIQTRYFRKLWSSVALWNCDHPANARLNLTMLNQWPGRDLHAFKWLADSEIGALPPEWNWLVGIQPKPIAPAIAHYTLGTPNMSGHEHDEHADLWFQRAASLQ